MTSAAARVGLVAQPDGVQATALQLAQLASILPTLFPPRLRSFSESPFIIRCIRSLPPD